jgi:hypothetical protein
MNISNYNIKIYSISKNIFYSIIDPNYINYINLNIINHNINKKLTNVKEKKYFTDINKDIIEQNIIEKDKNIENNNNIFIIKKIKKNKIEEESENNIIDTTINNLQKNEFDNFVNKKKNNDQLDLMNNLFEEQLKSGNIKKTQIKGDNLKIIMHDFVNNCIMQSILRYDKNNNVYILDVIKLKNNVVNYHLKTNTINKDNENIIFYEQYNKWYEINYTGIIKIEITNNMLILCLNKLKEKDKFRKELKDGSHLRGIKLKFIILNKITNIYYIKRNK